MPCWPALFSERSASTGTEATDEIRRRRAGGFRRLGPSGEQAGYSGLQQAEPLQVQVQSLAQQNFALLRSEQVEMGKRRAIVNAGGVKTVADAPVTQLVEVGVADLRYRAIFGKTRIVPVVGQECGFAAGDRGFPDLQLFARNAECQASHLPSISLRARNNCRFAPLYHEQGDPPIRRTYDFMDIFLHILWNNVLPLSLLIGLGVALHRAFRLDIRTLSKLNFYLFSPSLMFHLLYGTEIRADLFGKVLLFFAIFMSLQYLMLEVVIRVRGYDGGKKGAVRNSVLFYNSANYGIPINQLAFSGNTYTLAVQVIVMMLQALLPNTYGIYNSNSHRANWRKIVRVILSMPIIYIIPIALTMRGFHIPVPHSVDIAVGYLASGFFATALTTLGVQLGSMKATFDRKLAADVGIATVLRLIVGPALAWTVVWALNEWWKPLDPLLVAALIVSAAVPTSLSSVLLAVEFDNEKEFASQTVLVTTIASIVTVTAVIYLLQIPLL